VRDTSRTNQHVTRLAVNAFTQLSPKEKEKRGKGKKSKPQLCIYSSYQTVTNHYYYILG